MEVMQTRGFNFSANLARLYWQTGINCPNNSFTQKSSRESNQKYIKRITSISKNGSLTEGRGNYYQLKEEKEK